MRRIIRGSCKSLSKEELSKAGLLMWALWNARNRCKINNQFPDTRQIFRSIANFLEEFDRGCRGYLEDSKLKSLLSHPPWRSSDRGWWKLNTDASWSNSELRGDLGWVIRDSTESLVGAGCKQIHRKWSIEALEGDAIQEGLKVYLRCSNEEGLRPPLMVELDALGVVNVLLGESVDLSKSGLIFDEIKQMTKSERVVFSHCCREVNFLAHKVAHAAAAYGDYSVIFGPSPSLVLEGRVLERNESIPCWFSSLFVVNVGS